MMQKPALRRGFDTNNTDTELLGEEGAALSVLNFGLQCKE